MGFLTGRTSTVPCWQPVVRMRNLFTNPSAPTVDCGVAQVDAVTDLCHLVAGFCGALDRHSHLVQPGFATEATRIGSQRTA